MSMSRCFYEVLGVSQDASVGEIKKCYHAQALRYHPDKNAGDSEATEMFKQVKEAYEVLSDTQERAFYDGNRDHVLASDDEEDEKEYNEAEAELDLYKWSSREAFVDFTYAAGGFFSVYATVFGELDAQERTAKNGDSARPGFGGAGSDLAAVVAFYTYWLNFSTCRSDRAFAKHDKWDLADAPSPVMRRMMRQKNVAVRERARKMFNDKVRRLAQWVKAQDPRPCGHIDISDASDAMAKEAASVTEDSRGFHCVACNKWYKTAQMLSNHEKSAKHKQTVARVRRQLLAEDSARVELEGLSLEAEVVEEVVVEEVEVGADEARGGGGMGGGAGGGAGGGGGKKKKGRRDGAADGAEDGDGDGDGDDAAIDAAVKATALPSPALVAQQTLAAFQSTEEYLKMNKTQRRKALQQWEAEHEHIMQMLRADDKEPKAEAAPKKEKPAAVAKTDKTKVHGSGAHSREIKTPKKKKAVYGKARDEVDVG